MSKIREILLARRREVEAEMAPLKAELKQIDAALAAIEGKPAPSPVPGRRPQSIASMALELLKSYPHGLPTRRIVEKIEEVYGRRVANRNMSWHLSHLKRDGLVVLEGEHWRLPSENDEAPDSSESSAPNYHGSGGGTSLASGGEAGPLAALPGAIPAQPGE